MFVRFLDADNQALSQPFQLSTSICNSDKETECGNPVDGILNGPHLASDQLINQWLNISVPPLYLTDLVIYTGLYLSCDTTALACDTGMVITTTAAATVTATTTAATAAATAYRYGNHHCCYSDCYYNCRCHCCCYCYHAYGQMQAPHSHLEKAR